MALTNLDKLMEVTLDLKTSDITYNKLEFFLGDSNIFNVELSLKVDTTPLVNSDLNDGYSAKLIIVKPKTKEYVEINGIINGNIFFFEVSDSGKDQIGDCIFEFYITKDTETLVSKPGKFKVKPNITGLFNVEITADPDYDILRKLINEVKDIVGLSSSDPDEMPFVRKPIVDGEEEQVLTLLPNGSGKLVPTWDDPCVIRERLIPINNTVAMTDSDVQNMTITTDVTVNLPTDLKNKRILLNITCNTNDSIITFVQGTESDKIKVASDSYNVFTIDFNGIESIIDKVSSKDAVLTATEEKNGIYN